MSDNPITADQLRLISDHLADTCEGVSFIEDDELGVFRTYSGRDMYGAECIGLTLPNISAAFEVAMNLNEALAVADADFDLVQAFKTPHEDSMGRSMILYWPSISLEAEEDDEIEEQPYPGTPAFERA